MVLLAHTNHAAYVHYFATLLWLQLKTLLLQIELFPLIQAIIIYFVYDVHSN